MKLMGVFVIGIHSLRNVNLLINSLRSVGLCKLAYQLRF